MTREEYNDISAALDRIMKRVADDETLPKKAAIGAFGVLGGFQLFIKEYYEKHSTAAPQGLDEAAELEPAIDEYLRIVKETSLRQIARYFAQWGAKWMAEKGVSMEITPAVDWTDIDKFVYKHSGDNVIIQMRKK